MMVCWSYLGLQSSKSLHRNTKDINVQNVTVLYHGSVIIDEAEVVLSYGNRYISLSLCTSHSLIHSAGLQWPCDALPVCASVRRVECAAPVVNSPKRV